MARKRMIDFSIWTDPAVMKLSKDALIVFIGIITHSDDEGLLEADPRSLYFKMGRMDLTPDLIKAAYTELEKELVVFYDNQSFAWLPKWFKHQNLKGRRPQFTKLKRPPAELVLENQEYLQEWVLTYSTSNNQINYPWNTCVSPLPQTFQQQNEVETTSEPPVAKQSSTETVYIEETDEKCTASEAPVVTADLVEENTRDNELHTCDSRVTHSLHTSCPENKISEVKISEDINIAAEAAFVPAVASSPSLPEKKQLGLHKHIQDIFLTDTGTFADFGKEGRAIKGLIDKAKKREPDRAQEFLEAMIKQFQCLRGSDDFYAKQPFIPSALNASGIWERVLLSLKKRFDDYQAITQDDELSEYIANALQEVGA